jgi:Copper resistance protein D
MLLPDGPDILSVAFRAVSFTLLLNAAGIPIFIAAFGRLIPSTVPDLRRFGWKLAIGAMVFVVGHHVMEAARMTGEMSGVMDPAMQKMALLSREGAAFAARMMGMLLVTVGLTREGRLPQRAHAASANGPAPTGTPASANGPASTGAPASANGPAPTGRPASVGASAPTGPVGPDAISLGGALLSITAFTLVGHTSVAPHRLAAAALVSLHLLVAAFWLGALWPLYLAAKKEQPATTARVIAAFSLAAAWVVPLILLAGLGLTAVLAPSLTVFRQPYGQLLLVKVGLFAMLMAMASLNKWRFGPACAEGNTAAFERTVLIEYVLICAVLAVTAALTTFYSPEVA